MLKVIVLGSCVIRQYCLPLTLRLLNWPIGVGAGVRSCIKLQETVYEEAKAVEYLSFIYIYCGIVRSCSSCKLWLFRFCYAGSKVVRSTKANISSANQLTHLV